MYQPSHFKIDDAALTLALLQAFPLATIVRQTATGLQADHVPLLTSHAEDGTLLLRGHVARANPLWRQEGPCLAIFQAEQGYVSPGWYASKQVDGKVVPTWNYAVAHLQGTLKAHDDAAWLRVLLAQLTAQHESPLASPWQMEDAPPDYIDKMLAAIVGIEIRVQHSESKCKFSQNRSAADQESVLAALEQGSAAQRQLAQAMRNCLQRPTSA